MSTQIKLLVTGLVLAVILLFYYNLHTRNQLYESKALNKSLYQEIENNYTPDTELIYQAECVQEIIYSYVSFKSYFMENILQKKPVLIYRYPEHICESCLNEDLEEILGYIEKNGKESVLILPAFPDTREAKIKLNSSLHKFNYINIPGELFSLPHERNTTAGKRFFALINEEGNIQHIFFPVRDKTSLTQAYFSEIPY